MDVIQHSSNIHMNLGSFYACNSISGQLPGPVDFDKIERGLASANLKPSPGILENKYQPVSPYQHPAILS
jgi:hypothetical protein